MAPMTPERLAEIQAATKGHTEGPLVAHRDGSLVMETGPDAQDVAHVLPRVVNGVVVFAACAANAALFAAAPELLAEVARLHKVLSAGPSALALMLADAEKRHGRDTNSGT